MSRVLIVEDHQTLLRSLRRGLEVLGYEVLVTETGEEGFQLALNRDVDVVVLDLMLPGRSGLSILKDLRDAGFPKPVLILTAKDSPEERQRSQECGANAFLAKPFAFAEFLSFLEQLLEQSGPTSPPAEES